jgi:hypothetical protein
MTAEKKNLEEDKTAIEDSWERHGPERRDTRTRDTKTGQSRHSQPD